MKKRTVLLLLTAVFILTAAGCKSIQNAVKSRTPDINKAFTSEVLIKYNGAEAKGVITRYGTGIWDMEISEPESLAGLNISYGNNGITAELGELAFKIPIENVNTNAVFSAIFNSVDSAAGSAGMIYEQTDAGNTYTGENANGRYILVFNPQNNMLTGISIPDLGIEVEVLNVSELITDFENTVTEIRTPVEVSEVINDESGVIS